MPVINKKKKYDIFDFMREHEGKMNEQIQQPRYNHIKDKKGFVKKLIEKIWSKRNASFK